MHNIIEKKELNDIEKGLRLAHADFWAMGFAIVGIMVRGVLVQPFHGRLNLFIIIITYLLQYICMLFIICGYAFARRHYGFTWQELIPLKSIGYPSRIIAAAGWALGLFFIVTASNWLVARVIMQHAAPSPLVEVLRRSAWPVRAGLLAQVMVFTPILEELFFRHALQRALTTYGTKVYPGCANGYVGFLTTSLCFADLHGVGWGIPGLFCFAMGLCFLCRKQDVLTCIIAHGIYNFLVATVVLMPAAYS